MEDRIELNMDRTTSDEVNVGFSKSKESKYPMTIDLYWHMKELLTCGIESRLRGGCWEEDIILQRVGQSNPKYDAPINII